MLDYKLIVSIPSLFLAVRSYSVQYLHVLNNPTLHTQIASNFTTFILCGLPYVYTLLMNYYNEGYLTQTFRQEVILTYIGCSLFVLFWEYLHTPQLKDVSLLGVILSIAWFFRDDFLQIVLFNVFVPFGIFRSFLALVEIVYEHTVREITKRKEINESVYRGEVIFFIYTVYKRLIETETIEKSVILTVLAAVILYSGTIQRYQMTQFDIVDRSNKPKNDVLSVVCLTPKLVEHERLLLHTYRERHLLGLMDENLDLPPLLEDPNSPPSQDEPPPQEKKKKNHKSKNGSG